MVFGSNLGKRTEAAKQALLTYIWDQRLAEGDRLPSQAELCRRFQVGCATVDRAVQSLVRDQVLESRRGIGVFVKTPRPAGHPGRSVGIVGLIDDQMHMFNWTLFYSIQNLLQKEGCQSSSFPYSVVSHGENPLSMFHGLESNVARKTLHGIITLSALRSDEWRTLEDAGIAVCYVGPLAAVLRGVVIDTPAFIGLAMKELRDRGSRRPAMMIGPTPAFLADEIRSVWGGGWFEGYGIAGGREAACLYLGLPAAERPDAIICCDDMMAQGFYCELVRRQKRRIDYLPPVACMRNRQFDFDFPAEEVVSYMVDIDAMSRLAVDMLQEVMKGNHTGSEVIRYVPERYNR